jgi:hypothetical protein
MGEFGFRLRQSFPVRVAGMRGPLASVGHAEVERRCIIDCASVKRSH